VTEKLRQFVQIAARELELVRIKGALQRAEELSAYVATAMERHL